MYTSPAPIHNNIDTYTVEDEFDLIAPQWSGLRFAYWTDAAGKEYLNIPKGSTGNITLTANWRSMENIPVPYTGIRELWTDFDEKNGHQIFIYPLGEIQNVVLKKLDKKYKYAGGSASWQEDTSVAFDRSTAEEISKAVANSLSQTSEYGHSYEQTTTHSTNYEAGFSAGVEFSPIKDILSFNAQGDFNWSNGTENSWSNVTTNSRGETVEVQETLSNATTVTFNHTISEVFTTNYSVGENMPEGEYNYVYYGKVYVYAVITYEPASGNYRMDTYSVLDENDVGSTAMYTPPTNSDISILPNEGLPYDFSWTDLDNYLADAYYIQYDPDGGIGSMLVSAHTKGQPHTLSDNAFVKKCYSWLAWALEDGTLVYQNQEVTDLSEQGTLITVKAHWLLKERTLTFDPAGGSVPYSTKTVIHEDLYGTLPSPTKTGYTFLGWFLDSTPITSGSVVQTNTDHTLVAHWRVHNYTVTYHGNGATGGNTPPSTHTYNSSKNLSPNQFTRTGWNFLGWSTSPNSTTVTYKDGQSIKNLTATNNGIVSLYAVWELVTTTNYYFDPFEVNNGLKGANGFYSDLTGRFDLVTLMAQGYTIHISMNFNLIDIDAGSDGKYQYGFKMFNGTTDVDHRLYDSGTSKISKGTHDMHYNNIVNLKASDLGKTQIGFLFIEDTYSVFAVVTNRYKVSNLVMTVTFTK